MSDSRLEANPGSESVGAETACVGRVLYLDPWAGVSGDMLIAALLDGGRKDAHLEKELRHAVDALGLGTVAIEVLRDVDRGVSCTRLQVSDEGGHLLRGLAEIEHVLEGASLPERVRNGAVEAFGRLAAVEAAIHGCGVEEIHFHELGAVDTLVDVVGALVLIERLGVTRVVVGPIPLGGGAVEIAHGRIGVPAPATLQLLEGYPVYGGPEVREVTTPTGALLVRQLNAEPGPFPLMRVERVGYGAGSMKLEHGPNVLRAVIGRELGEGSCEEVGRAGSERDQVVHLESNLDDVSAEVVAHTCRLLRDAGALDVWTVAAAMKKERPGTVLHVLVPLEGEEAAVERIMAETGTLGVRRHVTSRWVAARGTVDVVVFGHEVRVKWGRWRGRIVSVAPEYEDAAAVSAAEGVPLKDVMQRAAAAAWDMVVTEQSE